MDTPNTPKRHLVTSALPYANGPLHLGHLAGAYLPADIYVRYLRAKGENVVFVCGSDEHGAAITMRAKKEGITPRDIIDKYHELNKSSFNRLGISFDIYHRTSEALHYETAQDFFKNLYEQGGQFEERTNEQYYDEEYNQFLADRYIMGTCPHCGHEEAYGDQCENCGKDLSPTELIKPVSTLSGKTPELRETKHWYFKLDKHNDWLRNWIETGDLDGETHHNAQAWKKHVLGQCLSWLEEGLRPRAITRDLDWGIPVPLEDAEGKVLYVWFDAPIGYISATRQWAIDHADKLENGAETWKDYWQSEDSELIHFIGKDNIVFHCIVFPAMLKAHGKYNLPINVPANQFLNFEGQKFSKSRGWGIEQHVYLEEFADFPNKEDALRFALLRNLPENRDSDFKWDEFIDFHDKDLADNLGNFINRVIVLTHKYFDGKAPDAGDSWNAPLAKAIEIVDTCCAQIEAFNFRGAIQSFLELSSYGNTYLQEVSPWKLVKADPNDPAIATSLFTCLQIVTALSALSEPFIPFTSPRLRKLLNLPNLQSGDLKSLLDRLHQGEAILPVGHEIGQSEILFAKIRDKRDQSRMQIVDRQKEKLAAILKAEAAKQAAATPPKEESKIIQFDDFAKLDIRTGTIIAAEPIKKADKLLKLTVDLGYEQRTVASGIAKQYKPEDVIGQQVLLLANLAPRKMRGVESQGMILMAENAEGKLSFVRPNEAWENGQAVK